MAAQLSEVEQLLIDRKLWESALFGHIDRVKQALQKGANFKCRYLIGDGDGHYYTLATPHTVAYIKGHNTIVHFLENTGATPDYDEIMLAAAVRGLVDIVKEALKMNVSVNVKEKDGDDDTALHLASGNGHIETVQLLLQSKADPNIHNKLGHSPLHIAYWHGHDNIVKLLCFFGGDMDQVRNDDLLLTSAENGNIENVTVALTSGANVNVHHAPYKNQKTALHLASKGGYSDIVQLLLNSNADPNIYDKEQQKTALHLASGRGYYDIVQLLLNSNADPNICDRYGRTPAHLAAQEGYVDVLKLLIEEGQADINATDKSFKE